MRKRWIGGACATVVAGFGWTAGAHAETVTFAYNGTDGADGTPQVWVVPAGVTTATFDLFGAAGGASGGPAFDHAPGGAGARLTATLPVTPGETLTITVGGAAPGLGDGRGGFNGGGASSASGNVFNTAGGGGGATDVRRGGTSLGDRILVAGGGGGGGSYGHGADPSGTGGAAGGAGGPSGGPGASGSAANGAAGGGGGGQPAGAATPGAGGAAGAGSFAGLAGLFGSLVGADGDSDVWGAGGAGGGGWFGGGSGGTGGSDFSVSGGAGGGGGGSSHADATATGVQVTEGANAGHGSAVITFTPPPAAPAPPAPPAPVIATVDRAQSPTAGGGVVTITGGGFAEGTVARFGDVVAPTTVLRYDRLQAVVPPHAAGVVALTVRNALGTSAPVMFTYVEPGPSEAGERATPDAGRACVVPGLRGRSVAGARRMLAGAGCRLGHVRRTTARRGARRARVIAQAPRAGTSLEAGAAVDVTTRRRAR